MNHTAHLPKRIDNELRRIEDRPKRKHHTLTGNITGLIPVRIDEHTYIYVPAERLEGAADRFLARKQADEFAHINSNKPYMLRRILRFSLEMLICIISIVIFLIFLTVVFEL